MAGNSGSILVTGDIYNDSVVMFNNVSDMPLTFANKKFV
jgi:hypothetical protein